MRDTLKSAHYDLTFNFKISFHCCFQFKFFFFIFEMKNELSVLNQLTIYSTYHLFVSIYLDKLLNS